MIRLLLAMLLTVSLTTNVAAQPKPAPQAKPEGEMRWALYVTLARPGSTRARRRRASSRRLDPLRAARRV